MWVKELVLFCQHYDSIGVPGSAVFLPWEETDGEHGEKRNLQKGRK